jgi:mono/diheme cytochrome c family protein
MGAAYPQRAPTARSPRTSALTAVQSVGQYDRTVQAYSPPGLWSTPPLNRFIRRLRAEVVKPVLTMTMAALLPTLSDPALGAGTEVDVSRLPAVASQTVDFTRDIAPIFSGHCYSCHGPKRQESSLRLDEKTGALQGGDTYGAAIIVPGKSAESVLVQAVAQVHAELKMPKKGERLSNAQVGLLRAWIDQGAVWPDTAVAGKNAREHWAFRPPVKPPLPSPKAKDWAQSPIDQFVLARLEKEKLKPAPAADRVTLLRRLHLDLTGLPPTIEEVDAFLADRSNEAFAKQVETIAQIPALRGTLGPLLAGCGSLCRQRRV